MIPVYQPYFTKKTLKYAHDAINSTWVSSHGKYLDLAEEKLKEITGAEHVLLTNNGTSATHLVRLALNRKYPKIKKIIVPSNVYVAAWNMFWGENLHPVDSDLNTWNMDLNQINDEDDQAILVVHNLGNIINVPKLKRDFSLSIFIEDNCEGFLGYYEGIKSGLSSFASSISFFGNKNITCGEGGAFLTNDYETAYEMNRIRCQGSTVEKFIFNGVGYNYRMTNVQAALLCGQIELLGEIEFKKENLFGLYRQLLQHEKIHFQQEEKDCINSNWMFGIRIDLSKEKIEELKMKLWDNGVETRPMFPPIYYHGHFIPQFHHWYFPNSETLYKTGLILPSYPSLGYYEVVFITDIIKKFLDENN